MARFKNEREARRNAQANANANTELWCVFTDTSGAWISERYTGHKTDWAGVHREIIGPDKVLDFPPDHPCKGDLGTIPLC